MGEAPTTVGVSTPAGACILRPNIDRGSHYLGLVVERAPANPPPAYNYIVDGTTWLVLDRKFRFTVIDDLALNGALADNERRGFLVDHVDGATQPVLFG